MYTGAGIVAMEHNLTVGRLYVFTRFASESMQYGYSLIEPELKIRNGFERIVDLMRDRSRQTAGNRQLPRLNQRSFNLLPLGYVGK
jgi:hypothetical protein